MMLYKIRMRFSVILTIALFNHFLLDSYQILMGFQLFVLGCSGFDYDFQWFSLRCSRDLFLFDLCDLSFDLNRRVVR